MRTVMTIILCGILASPALGLGEILRGSKIVKRLHTIYHNKSSITELTGKELEFVSRLTNEEFAAVAKLPDEQLDLIGELTGTQIDLIRNLSKGQIDRHEGISAEELRALIVVSIEEASFLRELDGKLLEELKRLIGYSENPDRSHRLQEFEEGLQNLGVDLGVTTTRTTRTTKRTLLNKPVILLRGHAVSIED